MARAARHQLFAALLSIALITAGCGQRQESSPAEKVPAEPSAKPGTEPQTNSAIFEDRAAESGLDFVHWNGMTGELYFVEMTGSGAALFDYDGDGDLDAFLIQGHLLGAGKEVSDAVFPPPPGWDLGDRLYRNDLEIASDGTRRLSFTDVTAQSGLDSTGYGMGAATGDVDNDGDVDLYVTEFGPNRLYLNRGDGSFEEIAAEAGVEDGRWSVSAAFVDVDHDGWLDLYVGNYVDFTLENHKPCRNLLGGRDYCGPLAYESVGDRLFRNLGPGVDGQVRFEDMTLSAGLGSPGAALGVIAADFDLDGWIDLYVANDGMPNHLWIHRGSGLSFEDQALLGGAAVNARGEAEASMGVDAGDVDADGDEDLFMTHLARETNTLYRNDGTGAFEDVSLESGLGASSFEMTGFGTAFLDWDNDGHLDLIAVNGAVKAVEELLTAGDPYPIHQPNQLFRALGGGRFEDVTALAGPAFELSEVSRGAALGDVDNDGDIDVLIANNSGPARLLVNQVGQDRPWLGLRLLGGEGPRDQLGAWVGVHRQGAPTLWRRVSTTGSFASARDPRLLFGLGGGSGVTRVEVRWPDGELETFTDVPTGSYTTLTQGSSADSKN